MLKKFSKTQLDSLIAEKQATLATLKKALDQNSMQTFDEVGWNFRNLAEQLLSGAKGKAGDPAYEEALATANKDIYFPRMLNIVDLIVGRKAPAYNLAKASISDGDHGLFDKFEEKLKTVTKSEATLLSAMRTKGFMPILARVIKTLSEVDPGTHESQDVNTKINTPYTPTGATSGVQKQFPTLMDDIRKFIQLDLVNGRKALASVIQMLDKIAGDLEAAGQQDLATQVDMVTNSLEKEADLAPEDMLETDDKQPMHDILESLKTENDFNQLVLFFSNPTEFLKGKLSITEGSPAYHAAETISQKINDLTQHLKGGAKALAQFGWDGARTFLQREFGGHTEHKYASSADHMSGVAQKLVAGLVQEVTERLRSMHPLTGAYGAVPEEVLHAAVKGGQELSALLEALKDPQSVAEEMEHIVGSGSTTPAPITTAPEAQGALVIETL